MFIGFSTGSLALGNYKEGVSLLQGTFANVIELSALRENELKGLLNSLNELNLNQFKYISFHAPSKLSLYSETELIDLLKTIAERDWPIIVHPDIIQDAIKWRQLGSHLCIENMDKRKSTGRTTSDLTELFERLPHASFCFDVAHARQVDPTMTEALFMLKNFGHRLKQLHVSDVNTKSQHEPLNLEAIFAFRRIANLIDSKTPIILESPVAKENIETEIKMASLIFDNTNFNSLIHFLNISNDVIFPLTSKSEFRRLIKNR
jgi:endonuclease IV